MQMQRGSQSPKDQQYHTTYPLQSEHSGANIDVQMPPLTWGLRSDYRFQGKHGVRQRNPNQFRAFKFYGTP